MTDDVNVQTERCVLRFPLHRFRHLFALLPGLAVTTYLWLVIAFNAGPLSAPGFIQNPDALVRLERIRQLVMGGDWFEKVLMRIGAQDHLVLHWTRPLDALVVAYAWLVEVFTTTAQPLLIAGITLSLPAAWLALVLAARLPGIVGERRVAVWGLGALFVSLLPYFSFVFNARGWPDHHGLMLIVFIASLLLGHAMLISGRRSSAWLFGLSQALALWISPESLVPIAALHAGLGMAWAFKLQSNVSRQGLRAALGFALGLVIALLIEYGVDLPGLELDRLSLFSLLVAGVLSALWGGLHHMRHRLVHIPQRIFFGLVVSVLAAGVVVMIVPQAIHGPMADADPWFVNVWTATFRDGFNMGIHGGLFLCAVSGVLGVWLMRTDDHAKLAMAYLLPSMLVFAGLSITSSMRWMSYGEMCAVPFILAGLGRLWDAASVRGDGLWRLARIFAPFAILLLAGFDAVLTHKRWLSAPTGPVTLKRQIGRQTCDINELVDRLRMLEQDHGPQVVMAHANITPTILFHTGHRVQSVPIHPDAVAVHESVNVFFSTTERLPPSVPSDLFITCGVGHEYIAYQNTPATLYARLSRGERVEGLTPVFLGAANQYKIFAIKYP